MSRTLINQTPQKIGQTVTLMGWVNTRRDHGKIVFIDLRDRSGIIQIVGAGELFNDIKSESVVRVTGTVKERPEKLVNPNLATGKVEVGVAKIEVLSSATDLPFDLDSVPTLQLPTLLDYRTFTLRHPREKDIFLVQEAVLTGFRQATHNLECVEVITPTISASATEGGAEVFKLDYYGHPAFLIQSPQLYKQMLVPVFERVAVTTHVYRAEPSVTTRHLSESVQMDCELGFMTFTELLDAMESVGRETIRYVNNNCGEIVSLFNTKLPQIDNPIPRLTMREAQSLILERTGADHTSELDLMPEDEREICRWALEEKGSDLVTITHFPTKKRAFYTKPDPENPEYSLSYDLLFRGVEIMSGSERIIDYHQLVEAIKNKGMDPANFSLYLSTFKYGMPPEGGFSFGLERITMLILELANVRQASLFPRDMERVDFRFSQEPGTAS